LEKEVPIAGQFLDCWPVFADAALDGAWRFVVAGEQLSPEDPLRDQHNRALEMLQRANILQRQPFDSLQQCVIHPLIGEYLRNGRWIRLSESKRQEYEARLLQYYRETLEAADLDYPLLLEWGNIMGALERAMGRSDWEGAIELARLLVGSKEAHLIRKQMWIHAKQVATVALAASEHLSDPSVEASLLLSLGLSQYRIAEYREAKVSFERALSLIEADGDPELRDDITLQIGRVAYRLTNYDAAGNSFEAVRDAARSRGDDRRLASALHELGRLSYRGGNLSRAAAMLREALQKREALGDGKGMAETLHEIARTLHREGLDTGREQALEEAESEYRRSLQLRKEVGDLVGQQATIHQLGLLAFDREDYSLAGLLYDECSALSETLNDRFWIAHNLYRSARLLWRLGDRDQAMERARGALQLTSLLGIGMREDVERWLESRSDPQGVV
jgi:tetratricopeptide (TPR) repeat protein